MEERGSVKGVTLDKKGGNKKGVDKKEGWD